ncbi:unnamed protein product [Paramecium sonneborni]|uniref:Tetratricopeptide repeat protein n=1 Tax=Paramecium sonneborni TaxID=65129 RepID=A0A8S1QX70_9CILI|nr:unnamed protein product [Paramecium sonneborni]
MNKIIDLQIKCSNKEHDSFVQLACFNENCKANRIYCLECLRLGYHSVHPNEQYDLIKLLQFIKQIRQKSDELIKQLSSCIEKINLSFSILSQGLKQKYQLSEDQIQRFDAKQLNQALDQMLKYNETAGKILLDVGNCSKETFIQLNKISTQFELNELIYCDQIEQQKGQAQDLEGQNQLNTKILATSLIELNKYNDAIICIDKALLLLDSNHVKSFYLKAKSLLNLRHYNDAITWADKALLIDSKHIDSLCIKGKICYSPMYQQVLQDRLAIIKKHLLLLNKLCYQIQSMRYQQKQKLYVKQILNRKVFQQVDYQVILIL